MKIYSLFSKTKNWELTLGMMLTVAILSHLTAPHALAATKNLSRSTEFVMVSGPQLSYEQLAQSDYLVNDLKDYLEKQKSPLSIYAEEIVKLSRWEMALAVSKVESGMGVYCANNNCSGIGVHPTHPAWRKYPTKLAWFKDMSALMEKPMYKERFNTCQKMRGVYVVPGSDRWVRGCAKTYTDLLSLASKAESKRLGDTLEGRTVSIQPVLVASVAK